jgi:transcriptional regulator with XRE-family HTH domain
MQMELNKKLRLFRKQKGLTLKDLKDLTGLSLPFLSEIERGDSNPSLDSLQLISKAYDISLTELIGDTFVSQNDDLVPIELKQAIDSGEIDKGWLSTLKSIEYRGKQPDTVEGWIRLYNTLKSTIK